MNLQLGVESKACSFCHVLHPKTKEFWYFRSSGWLVCKRAHSIKRRLSDQKNYHTRIVSLSRQEDIKKNRYVPENFIDQQWVLDTQKAQRDLCYYCDLLMLYGEGVNRTTNRMGLTVERLDNNRGHNKDNCVLCHKKCQGVNHPQITNKK